MTAPRTRVSEPRRSVTLRAKLSIATLALSAVMLASLLAYFGPHAERSFVAGSENLIAKSADTMSGMARSHVANSRAVLVELIRHSADTRRRALLDMPLTLYGGDVERMRAAIDKEDSARADRHLSNVRVLGRELERRAAAEIDAHVKKMTAEQEEMTAAFGADLSASCLLLSGGLLAVLIVFLGVGLERLVVRPVHQLRQATRRVAAGDLEVEIDASSSDELGDLAGDFAAMVEQLRASRDEIREKNEKLESWNQTLQQEVERKTRHLEDALEHLRTVQHELAQADKMASVGTLAGGIAHEFNNLIGGIRGCIGDALQDDRSPQRREPLEVALRATERATAVTEKLLRFARPRIEHAEEVSLGDLIHDVVDLVEPQARHLGVAIETVIPSQLAAVVDSNEMHQVFLNLLTNALQAMPGGGRIVVEASRNDGGGLAIRVTDTGVGIAPGEIDHVFDPFYTSKNCERDPARRGTGLGLSVSYRIVEAHGGLLSVDSRPGGGSTFTVSLPAAGPRRAEHD